MSTSASTSQAAARPSPQRRCFTYLDDAGERTITVLGERIVPLRADPLPWDALARVRRDLPDRRRRRRRAGGAGGAGARGDAAGDGGAGGVGVRLDVLVRSASDPGERYEPGMLDPAPRWVVSTRGGRGGSWSGETTGSWQAAPLPGPPVDAYGCGDSFAAALAYGLGAGMALPEAIELGARCGAACLTGRGPYGAQFVLGRG